MIGFLVAPPLLILESIWKSMPIIRYLLEVCIMIHEMVNKLQCYYSIVVLNTCIAEFRAYFEKFGKVLSAEVMFNRETHKSRGFGFIVFENERGADLVCAEAECVINGKVVCVVSAI
jgi:hypothetical protein